MPPGTGAKQKGDKSALPLNLKVNYSIGRDTPPVVFSHRTAELEIKAEITGDITIEMISAARYISTLDITLSKDGLELKQKLRKGFDPAIRELLSEPKVVFESGQVKIKTKMVPKAKADIGAYTVEVKLAGPNHLSGSLSPPTIKNKIEAKGHEYQYSADITFKVDVVMRPRKQPETRASCREG